MHLGRTSNARLATLTLTALLGAPLAGCSRSPQGVDDVDDLVVEGLEDIELIATVGDPLSFEARVMGPGGGPAARHEWRWSIESFGHEESASSEAPSIERVTVTPSAASTFTVWGQVGLQEDEDDDKISWRSVRGPTLHVWGAKPQSILFSETEVTLAINERRPLIAQGIGRRKEKIGRQQILAIGHHPTRFTSSDPEIVTVSDAGLLEAKAHGQATITATYQSIEETVAVTVSPDLVMGPPTREHPRAELYDVPVGGDGFLGVVDDDGYPILLGGGGAATAYVPGMSRVSASGLARWTGTGMGFERFTRAYEVVRPNVTSMVRGVDDTLWIAYVANFPRSAIVVAHRPIDGGPDDWRHEEFSLADELGERIRRFGGHVDFGLRARPDGGVWLAFSGSGDWAEPTQPEGRDTCMFALALAEVTTGARSVELVLEVHDEPTVVNPTCPNYGNERPRYLIRRSETPGRPDITNVPFGEQPSRLFWNPSSGTWRIDSLVSDSFEWPTNLFYYGLIQAIDPDDPARASRLVMLMRKNPSRGDDDGEGLGIVLPEQGRLEEPEVTFPNEWAFQRAWAFMRGEEFYYVTDTGTPIWQWLMVDDERLSGERASRFFTTVDQFGDARLNGFDDAFSGKANTWAFGGGFLYTGRAGVELPRTAHPLFADDVDGDGRFLEHRIIGRPTAMQDGRILLRSVDVRNDPLVLTLDAPDAALRVAGADVVLRGALDIRAVGDTLLALFEDAVFDSIDGASWFDAGSLADQPVDPWKLVDGEGNHHTTTYDTLTQEVVWEWSAPGSEAPTETRRLALTFEEQRCEPGEGALGPDFVTSSGMLVRCTSREVVGEDWIVLRLVSARPQDDAFRVHRVGIMSPFSMVFDDDEYQWRYQVTETADGRVLVGFTGLDPVTLRSRAMLVELGEDGSVSMPHVLRPVGGYGQEFQSMEPLPGGGVVVVFRDHGMPDISSYYITHPEDIRRRGGFDLLARIDALTPDDVVYQRWLDAGLSPR